MIAKFTQTDEGLALILDQDMVNRLHLPADTPVEITDDGRVVTIAKIPPAPEIDPEFQSALAWAVATYPKTLRDLAQ